MKPNTINAHLNFWANILLFLGLMLLLLFGYLLFQRYNPQKLAFNMSKVKASQNNVSALKPAALKIDTANILLPITESEVIKNKWQASSTSVSYLKSSPIPGEKGNSILYGHNWPNLLGNLNKVKPGEKITIIYEDNSSKDFEVEYKIQVSPSETSILEDSNDARITLYTCSGFLDSKRLVIVAKLIS